MSTHKRRCRHQGKVQEKAHLLYGKIRNDIVELLQVAHPHSWHTFKNALLPIH
jgi:hypothetical protein